MQPGGQSVATYGPAFAQVPDTAWHPVAVADSAASGSWTLVWQNAVSGQVCRWLMSGTSVAQYGPAFAQVSDASWHVVGAPDLDGDGKSDLLWWNSNTGAVCWWAMDLSRPNEQQSPVLAYNGAFAQVSDTSWHLVGAPDMDGDGQADLLWENANTGAVCRWLMNGTQVKQYGPAFAQVQDTSWSIQGER